VNSLQKVQTISKKHIVCNQLQFKKARYGFFQSKE